MDHKIIIEAGKASSEAILAESQSAMAIWSSFPIESTCNIWGDEIYFSIPLFLSLDDTAKEIIEMGDLGYWPSGKAPCIFFGPTPIIGVGEIRPASAVNIIGKIIGDPKIFKRMSQGARVHVAKAE